MNMEKLKESMRKQCDSNHKTIVYTAILKKFNKEHSIVGMMKPPLINKTGEIK